MAAINQCGYEPKQLIRVNGLEDYCLPDSFNKFFLRFERSDFIDDVSRLRNSLKPRNDILISQDQVKVLFKKTKKGKPQVLISSAVVHGITVLSNSAVFLPIYFKCVLTTVSSHQSGNLRP